MRHALKEAGLQIPELTDRKHIRGCFRWVSIHRNTMPIANKPASADVPGFGRRMMLLPGEVSGPRDGIGEVSRGRSTRR